MMVDLHNTVWPEPIWIKVKKSWLLLPQHQSTHLRGPESASIQTQIYLLKVSLNVNIVKQDLLNKKQFLKILWSEVWKGGFQLIQILGLLGMFFDAVVAELKTFLLLFWLTTLSFMHLSMQSSIRLLIQRIFKKYTFYICSGIFHSGEKAH